MGGIWTTSAVVQALLETGRLTLGGGGLHSLPEQNTKKKILNTDFF